MSCCPRCGYHLEEEIELDRLRALAGELGIFVDGEDTVDATGAARLTGRGGITARGTSKREDVLDTIIHLKRPSDYEPDQGARFEVHLEKARGVFGDDAKPFEAQLETIDGADHWHVKSLEDANAARVIEASKEGLSSREIAKELGVSHSTVNRIRRKHKFAVIDGGKSDVEHGTP
jgi:hypothetical protein